MIVIKAFFYMRMCLCICVKNERKRERARESERERERRKFAFKNVIYKQYTFMLSVILYKYVPLFALGDVRAFLAAMKSRHEENIVRPRHRNLD